MRPLPDLDLARIALMPRDQKRHQLEKLKLKRPPHTYNPFRRSILDIFNASAGPLAISSARTPLDKIIADIRCSRESADGVEANLRVAKGLYAFATNQKIQGRHQQFLPLSIAMGIRVSYWSPVVINIDDRPVVPFIDPRLTYGLTAKGRRFAFSVMHERIRVADPDFANVRLAIIQFEKSEKGPRPVIPHFDDSVELLDIETLENATRETYEIWKEVLGEREEMAKRSGSGTKGDLL